MNTCWNNHSSIEGPPGCFSSLVIMKRAAIHLQGRYSWVQFLNQLGKYLKEHLLDHMIRSWVCQKRSSSLPAWLSRLRFHPREWGFLLLRNWQTFVCCDRCAPARSLGSDGGRKQNPWWPPRQHLWDPGRLCPPSPVIRLLRLQFPALGRVYYFISYLHISLFFRQINRNNNRKWGVWTLHPEGCSDKRPFSIS